jgi:hypothetical protein
MPYDFRIEWSCLLYIFHNNSLDHPIRQAGRGCLAASENSLARRAKDTASKCDTHQGRADHCFVDLQGRWLRDYLDCAADIARLLLWPWCGFAQVPSDRAQFVAVVSEVVDGPWFFRAALVGPIATLNVAPLPESEANASCGIAIAMTPIPASRSTRRPMMFMTDLSQNGCVASL